MRTQSLITILMVLTAQIVGCGDPMVEDEFDAPEETVERNMMPSPKADRATQDPEEVLSEGSGEHGVEAPTQQDELLHRTLQAAAWAAQVRFPQGAQHFLHFLGNSGEIFQMNVDRLLQDNPMEIKDEVAESFKARIEAQLAEVRAEVDAYIEENGAGQEPVELSWSGEWSQFYATQGDWYWALGGFQFRVDAQVSYTPDEPVKVTYRIDVEDRYNWDLGKEIELRFNLKITDEMFQRLHIVGIAQEFSIEGSSSEQSFEYAYDGEIEITETDITE